MGFNLFKKNKGLQNEEWDRDRMFGPNINFATSEAYKLLRTNIMYSFSTEDKCRVIGVTSSVRGEGKSTTACNISYSLAEAGKRVLLLEADLRLPSIADKLGLNKTPGLTNLLTTRIGNSEIIQHCDCCPDLDIITSGDIPPNPSELLSSSVMAALIEKVSGAYDYIIIDLPPVSVVADALVISKILDGIIMVVRSGAVEQRILNDSIRQIEFIKLRILGFVFRSREESSGIYKKKYGEKYEKKAYGKYVSHSVSEGTC